MNREELVKKLEKEGYKEVREIEGKGLCGLRSFVFTTGICYGLDEYGYEGRYCYPNPVGAFVAYLAWDGKGHPEGRWIKHKGRGIDEGNPQQINRI